MTIGSVSHTCPCSLALSMAVQESFKVFAKAIAKVMKYVHTWFTSGPLHTAIASYIKRVLI